MEKVQRTAARWTCRRWRNTCSVGEMLNELQWPTLEARRDQSSLLFFNKIHCVTMSIDKDKYLTPSQSTRYTRSSHNSQYCRPQTYSDALKYFFPQGLFLIGRFWLHLWLQLRPQRSSGLPLGGRTPYITSKDRLRTPKLHIKDVPRTYKKFLSMAENGYPDVLSAEKTRPHLPDYVINVPPSYWKLIYFVY